MAFQINKKSIGDRILKIYLSKFEPKKTDRRSSLKSEVSTEDIIKLFRSDFETLFRFLDAVMTIKTKQPFDFESYLNSDDVLVVPQGLSSNPEAFIPNYTGAMDYCLKDKNKPLNFGRAQLKAINKLIRDALQGFTSEAVTKRIEIPQQSNGLFKEISAEDINSLNEDEPMKIVRAVNGNEDYISTNKFAEALYKLGKKLHQRETASAA